MTLLPTEKHQPAVDGLLYRKTLLSGAPKLGKTVTGINFTERPLIIDAEGSAEGYECFRAPCPDWLTFRKLGAELAADPARGGYTGLVVDTADELARLCRDHVLTKLAGHEPDLDAGDYLHPSDFGYGKGWDAVTEEWRVRVAKLCSLGLPVLFISHEKQQEVEDRTGTRLVFSPDVGNKGMRNWLLGFVDVILRTAVVKTKDGDRHVIIAKPSPDNLVGGRTPEGAAPLPPMFSLSGEALFRALSARADVPTVEPVLATEQPPEGKQFTTSSTAVVADKPEPQQELAPVETMTPERAAERARERAAAATTPPAEPKPKRSRTGGRKAA